jgi:hypothetical protein
MSTGSCSKFLFFELKLYYVTTTLYILWSSVVVYSRIEDLQFLDQALFGLYIVAAFRPYRMSLFSCDLSIRTCTWFYPALYIVHVASEFPMKVWQTGDCFERNWT